MKKGKYKQVKVHQNLMAILKVLDMHFVEFFVYYSEKNGMVAIQQGHFELSNDLINAPYSIDSEFVRGKEHGEPILPVFKNEAFPDLLFFELDYFEFIEF